MTLEKIMEMWPTDEASKQFELNWCKSHENCEHDWEHKNNCCHCCPVCCAIRDEHGMITGKEKFKLAISEE